MAMEIPTALIRQIQIGLRKQAGVPSYDPTDPSLPSLPSLEESIAKLDDPSIPSYLRCKKCRGGLLRGIQSTLCIFCGEEQRRDGFSHTISFNSTAAYRKLLESLELNGSEAINSDSESTDSNKGRDTSKGGLVLSSLLDLELKWPTEKEENDNSSINKAPSMSAQTVNLSGVDLDTFFSDTKNETASNVPSVTSEQLMPKEQIISTESHVPTGSKKVGFFENLQSSDEAVSSAGGDFGNSFAVWEVAFQSASSENFSAESKSIDHFQGSSTIESARPATAATTFAAESQSVDLFQGSSVNELASHATAAPTYNQHTVVKHESSSKGNGGESMNEWDQFSSSGNWIQDDIWPNTTDQFKSKTNKDEMKNDVQNVTSITDNWGQDDLWPINSIKESDNPKNINDNDDSLESWQDFTSSSGALGGLSNAWTQTDTVATSSEHPSGTKPVDIQDMEFGSFPHSDSFSGALDGQKGSSEVNVIQLNASVSTSSIKEFNNAKSIDDNDESFEAWQDFASSNEAPGALSNSWSRTGTEATSSEHASGTKSVDLQDMEFGSFLHSDSFSGALGGQKGSNEVNDVQLDASVSTSSIKEINNTTHIHENDNSLEAWQDFTSSNEAPGGLSNSWTLTTIEVTPNEHASRTKSVDPQDMEFGSFFNSDSFSGAPGGQKGSREVNDIQLDASVSTTRLKEPNNTKNISDNDDSLEAWQDFTSSNEAPRGLSSLSTKTVSEATSYEHVSGTKSVDVQDMKFGSFLHSDSFSGALDGQKGSGELNDMQLGASVSNRMNRMDEKTRADSIISGVANTGEISTAANLETNSKVEMLLSQMPDLSFMLDSNLSFPKKVNGSDLNS